MPRAPSIHLRVARLLKLSMDRLEYKFDDQAYVPSKEDAEVILRLAQADKAMRGRTPTDEEVKEAEELEAREIKPREISDILRKELLTPLPPNNVREDVDT